MITDYQFSYFPHVCTVPKQTNGYDCGVFVCRYAYALYQARFTPITYVDLHLEKPPLKTAITQSTFFNFDDLEVTLLRTEVGVLIDNLAKVYSRVERKLAAKPKEAEENINSDLKEDRIEEEKIQSESTVLCKFVEESMTEVPDIVINPQQVSKKQKDVFKELFYKQLDTKFGGKLGTKILTNDQYNRYVDYLRSFNNVQWRDRSNEMNNVKQRYYLKGNVRNHQLYRVDKDSDRGNRIATYERVFDIIDMTHVKLGHVRDCRTMYNHINKVWYGVTEKIIKVYRDLCPTCLKDSKPPKSESFGPLQMMISDTIGSRAQMDLIDMRRKVVNNYKWILCYVDHHSGFAHIACLKNKKAETVGKEMVRILSTAVIPEVLQSDNGGEFLGECVRLIRKHFDTIRIVKGKARKPSTQGIVERSNAPFKRSLYEWMEKNPGDSWAEVGAYIVNAQMNQRPS